MTATLTVHLARMRDMPPMTTQTETRTRYAIKSSVAEAFIANGLFAHDDVPWTNELRNVLTFDSETVANAHAIMVCNLSLDMFSIEPVAV